MIMTIKIDYDFVATLFISSPFRAGVKEKRVRVS